MIDNLPNKKITAFFNKSSNKPLKFKKKKSYNWKQTFNIKHKKLDYWKKSKLKMQFSKVKIKD